MNIYHLTTLRQSVFRGEISGQVIIAPTNKRAREIAQEVSYLTGDIRWADVSVQCKLIGRGEKPERVVLTSWYP